MIKSLIEHHADRSCSSSCIGRWLIDCYLQKHKNREECYSKELQVSLQREIIDTLDNSHLKSMKSLWFSRIMQQIITGLGIPAVFAIIPQRTSFVEVHFTCIILWCSNRLCSKLSNLLNIWRWQQIIIMWWSLKFWYVYNSITNRVKKLTLGYFDLNLLQYTYMYTLYILMLTTFLWNTWKCFNCIITVSTMLNQFQWRI